jgi:predicted membrane protein
MEKHRNSFGGRFFFGFILIAVGVIMILHRMGALQWEVYDLLLSWKMLLVAIGAFVFLKGNKGAGIIVMATGVFFLLPELFENYKEIRQYFGPAVLLLVGAVIIFAPRPKRLHRSHFDPANRAQVSNDIFDEFIIFGAREINMVTPNLLGGRSTSIFGGTEIDLRQSEISPEGCSIEVTTLFGAHVLKVPNDWTVLNKVTTIFGGFSDMRVKDALYYPNPEKTIIVTGVCIFGGTEVRNFSKIH